MEGIANQNEGRSENTTPSSYQQVVKQLARDSAANKDEYVKAYTFEGIYPSNISAIDVSYDDTDTIEEFYCRIPSSILVSWNKHIIYQ